MSLLVGGMGAGGKLIITGIRKKTPKSISTYNSNTKPRKNCSIITEKFQR